MRILTIVFLLLCCPHVSHADTLLKKLECGVLHEAVPAITLQSEGTPRTLLIIGSSSTSGVGAGAPENAYPAQTANHLRQALKRTDITVVARGKGGERAKAAL
ncbi:MAG: SGNH/GDSL hydrolase family protein, partial [Pseudomonadota bacterium]